jgi:hypothetical protein
MDIGAVIASVKTAIDTLGKLRELSKTMQNVELKTTIARLDNELADTQMKLAELKREILTLQEENESLRGMKAEKPTKKWGCYVFEGDPELYCPGCYAKGKKSPTTRLSSKFRKCSVCQTTLGSS